MAAVIATRRFSVEEYHRMAEVGILKPGDRVELIGGDIVPMAPMSSRHAAVISKIARWLHRSIADQATVRAQSPLRLDDYSEPEPDVALVRANPRDYADEHPGPADVFLLIEVAGSSLAFDREVKIPRYARAGVREVWLVNLELRQVETHCDPAPFGYRSTGVRRSGESIAPQAFPEAAVGVDEMLA